MANFKRSCFLCITAGCLLEQSGLHIFSLETGMRNVSQLELEKKDLHAHWISVYIWTVPLS